MTYPTTFLEKVRSFGILGYSVDKIIDLCEPDNEEQFRTDFTDPQSEIYRAYRKGKTTGEYNLDKVLFDESTKQKDLKSNELLKDRMQRNKVDDLIFSHFGL